VKYDKYFFDFYPFLDNSPTGLIFTLDGLNNVDLHKDEPFGGFIDILPHLGGQIPQQSNFVGMNRHFPAKQTKY